MAKLTILQAVPRLDTGGSELATIEIAEAVTRAGASALVATEGGHMATAVTEAGGEIIPLPMASKNPFTILANAQRLTRLIEQRGVDLVHARSRAPAWSALIAARRTGRPFVTTYHGAYGDPLPFKNFYSGVMARGDRVIANSLYTARLIAERHRLPPDRIRVIYRGIDLAKFDPLCVDETRIARLREEWGVSPGRKIVLQAARMTGLKGHRRTIEAAAVLAREGALDDAAIIFAGDAPGKDAYRQELLALIARNGLEAKIRMVGHCRDMPAAFSAARVAVLPSLVPETFGRTSIEAQAMGCPVIISESGALPETIVSPAEDATRFTGWPLPPKDPDALAARMREALRLSPEERAAIAARASARARSQFTLAQMQAKTLAVYDELLGSALAERFAVREAC
jgi:glycosyltransferase involved in cell wall biosynthesis